MTSLYNKVARDGHAESESGFTLLELLIVLAVIALATGLVAVNWRAPSKHPNLEQVAGRVAATMWASRSLAIRAGTETHVAIDVENRSFGHSSPLKVLQLPSAISVDVIAADHGEVEGREALISFFPDGTSTGGKIVLSSGGRSVTIAIDWMTGLASSRDVP